MGLFNKILKIKDKIKFTSGVDKPAEGKEIISDEKKKETGNKKLSPTRQSSGRTSPKALPTERDGAETKGDGEEITKTEEKKPLVAQQKDAKKTASKKQAKTVKVDKENTKDAYKVLVKPIISEKAAVIGKMNQYVFEISPNANRVEVKKAIAAVYGIVPTKVNIINMRGKTVRFGRFYGKRKNWKKAIVTLPEGKSIEIYEGT